MISSQRIKETLDRHDVSESDKLSVALAEILNKHLSGKNLSETVHEHNKRMARMRGEIM